MRHPKLTIEWDIQDDADRISVTCYLFRGPHVWGVFGGTCDIPAGTDDATRALVLADLRQLAEQELAEATRT